MRRRAAAFAGSLCDTLPAVLEKACGTVFRGLRYHSAWVGGVPWQPGVTGRRGSREPGYGSSAGIVQ